MDVLIAGAGVGGLALAHGLIRDGHQVRILEQAPSLREGGAAVTVSVNGAAALAGLGIPLEGVGGLIEEMEFCDANARVMFRFDMRVLQRRTGFPVVVVPRERLIAHLAWGLPADLVQFDRAVDTVAVQRRQVQVTDSQGDLHTAPVVVGADGHRSAVRRSILSPLEAAPSGWATWQGLSRVLPELASGTKGRFLVGDAGFCGLMPAGDGLLQWWFHVPWSPTDSPLDDPVAGLRQRFARFAGPVPALLEAVTDAEIGLYPHVIHQIPDVWGTGPTTLIGDAAHAFPPSQGQGANQTLDDAWLLTRALILKGDPAELLRRYEARRAPRVRRVAKMAAAETTSKVPGAATRFAVRLVPASVAGHAYLSLIRSWSSVLNGENP